MNNPSTDRCQNCGGDTAIRNPTGHCDHLYYPENVPKSEPTERCCDSCWDYDKDVCINPSCPNCHTKSEPTDKGWRERPMRQQFGTLEHPKNESFIALESLVESLLTEKQQEVLSLVKEGLPKRRALFHNKMLKRNFVNLGFNECLFEVFTLLTNISEGR